MASADVTGSPHSRFDVTLRRLPPSTEQGVKLVRLATGMDLRLAAEVRSYMAAHLPCSVVAGVSGEKAAGLLALIESLGGEATVAASQLAHPMALWPDADALFEWRQWFGLTRK